MSDARRLAFSFAFVFEPHLIERDPDTGLPSWIHSPLCPGYCDLACGAVPAPEACACEEPDVPKAEPEPFCGWCGGAVTPDVGGEHE